MTTTTIITLNREFNHVVHNTTDQINQVFPDLQINTGNKDWLYERAILVPLSETAGRSKKELCAKSGVTFWSICVITRKM